MITTKLKSIFDGNLDTYDYQLYIIRDPEVVFYVGKTDRGCFYRIGQHLGYNSWNISPLGWFINHNKPLSDEFDVVLLKTEEAHNYIYDDHQFGGIVLELAEEELIKCLHPCLNGTHNYGATPIPLKYKKSEDLQDFEHGPGDFIDIKIE